MNVQTLPQSMRVNVVEPWVEELASSIAASQSPVLPHGRRTKTWLSDSRHCAATAIDVTQHAGVVTYEPSEFLITARAGTSLLQLQAALAERGQFLPCDPLFAAAGGTIGGTVASGISGSSRLLYGSLRDFVMEVQFIDGLGKIVRGGGKVVKNAAGFDLPKLMVGSYGRLGVITELTLKVYPRPTGAVTLLFDFADVEGALRGMQRLLAKPLPVAAADLMPSDVSTSGWRLATRFAAPLESLTAVAKRAELAVGKDATECLGPASFAPPPNEEPTSEKTLSDEAEFWRNQANFVESNEQGFLVRIAMGPNDLIRLDQARQQRLAECSVIYSGGCSIAWLRARSVQEITSLHSLLEELELSAVLVAAGQTGNAENASLPGPWLGSTSWCKLARRVQQALDPNQRFVGY